MAAVTKGTAYPSVPVGELRVIRGTVTQDVAAGDLLVRGANGWSLGAATVLADKRGFAAMNYKAGDSHCSIFTHGQMSGWTGLTPGTPLYPGAAGGLDTVAPVPATGQPGFTGLIHAISTDAVEFTL